ncbi:MAG: hypothetical protein RLO12_20325 [Fulvivirga sp.]
MKNPINLILFSFLIISLGCAQENNDNDILSGQDIACCNDIVQSKNLAKKLILGKWIWNKTVYPRRGFGTTIETPESTNKELIYEFSGL